MTKKSGKISNAVVDDVNADQWPGVDSRYRLIVLAAQRSKQLQQGSLPRIETSSPKHRSTSIAVEEVKQGLVPFTVTKTSEGQK